MPCVRLLLVSLPAGSPRSLSTCSKQRQTHRRHRASPPCALSSTHGLCSSPSSDIRHVPPASVNSNRLWIWPNRTQRLPSTKFSRSARRRRPRPGCDRLDVGIQPERGARRRRTWAGRRGRGRAAGNRTRRAWGRRGKGRSPLRQGRRTPRIRHSRRTRLHQLPRSSTPPPHLRLQRHLARLSCDPVADVGGVAGALVEQRKGVWDERRPLGGEGRPRRVPLAVWNLTAFFRQMPTELEKAARSTGARPHRPSARSSSRSPRPASSPRRSSFSSVPGTNSSSPSAW